MNHCIIITGYPDNKKKLKNLLQFSNTIKSRKNNCKLCYSSHLKPDSKIYDFYDYVIYTKHNPILNWDFIDDATHTFGMIISVNDQKIYYPQPYHGYAHHLSICDGISLGLNLSCNSFTIMNSDVIDFCIESIDNHITELSNNTSTFYTYNKDKINTEFFSCNKDFANFLYLHRYYNLYKKFNLVEYELFMKKMISQFTLQNSNFNYNIIKHPIKEDTFGKINFGDIINETLNDKYFLPYFRESFFVPFTDKDNKKYIIVKNTEKIKCFLNDKLLNDFVTEIHDDTCNLKIYEDKKIIKNIYLHDKRQFGYIL